MLEILKDAKDLDTPQYFDHIVKILEGIQILSIF
jgi:hypothetical protein